MIVAGLTGGIATGKSTVAAMFKALGARVVDAEGIAGAVVRPGRPAWQAVVNHFGPGVLQPDGEIDRRYRGDPICNNSDSKIVLNQLLHPFVWEEVEKELQLLSTQAPEAVVLVDAPLLIESGMHTDMAWTIVVYVPEHVQLQRLMVRDGLKEHEAVACIRTQMGIEEKKRLADIVIDNTGTVTQTQKTVADVYGFLQEVRNGNPRHSHQTDHRNRRY